MSRPATLKVGNTSYWTIMIYTSAGVLVDADSTPTIVVYKNGSLTADVVTVTKRSATTGIYDSYYNPSSEVEGDCFTIQETATISSQAYVQSWNFEILAAERGTDGANTVAPNTVAPDNASVAAILADTADLQANQGQWLTATTTVSSNMRGTDGANTVVPNTLAPDNSSIASIKSKTDQLAFTVTNQVDANALTGGGGGGDSKEDIYTYFTASSRQDTFKATGFNTVAPDNASIANILADTNDLQQSQGDWLTATGFATVNADNASISLILADTNELQGNQGDWSTATGFATVNADNSSIAAIKAKTDSLTFSIANQVDANAVTGGGQPIGSGAISHTITVNIDGNPATAVDAWVTTDVAGTNVVAGTLVSDNAGQVTFQLDAGSYYLWCQRSGVNFSNPTAFTVS
jgi:hypothetical protein